MIKLWRGTDNKCWWHQWIINNQSEITTNDVNQQKINLWVKSWVKAAQDISPSSLQLWRLWPYPVVHKHLTGSLYSKYGLLIWSNASQGCQITFVSMPQLIPSQNACLKCRVHISFVFPACEMWVHHPWCCWILHHQLNAIWRRFAITLKASLWAWGFSNIK